MLPERDGGRHRPQRLSGRRSKIKKKLLGRAGVLLAPELGEKRRQDAVEGLKPVDQGVVGGAEGDEQLFPGDARAVVVDVEAAIRFPADAAGVAVALEDVPPQSGEVDQVMPLGGVAGHAPSPYERRRATTGPAPQGELGVIGGGTGEMEGGGHGFEPPWEEKCCYGKFTPNRPR